MATPREQYCVLGSTARDSIHFCSLLFLSPINEDNSQRLTSGYLFLVLVASPRHRHTHISPPPPPQVWGLPFITIGFNCRFPLLFCVDFGGSNSSARFTAHRTNSHVAPCFYILHVYNVYKLQDEATEPFEATRPQHQNRERLAWFSARL